MKIEKKRIALGAATLSASLFLFIGRPALVGADSPAKEPPTSWIDPDTGHRIVRLTREPGSASFYFNFNSYTPDGKEMVYTTPEGISVLELSTLKARQVISGPADAIVVGRKAPVLYYTRKEADKPLNTQLWSTNIETGETRMIATLPPRGKIATINADETLAAGTYIEGDRPAPREAKEPQIGGRDMYQSVNKPQNMQNRLAAQLPMCIYTLNLTSGNVKILLRGTDWLNHLQFSPTDPTLLMYCHEGAWSLVDRLWTIRTDGTQNTLIHKRIMEMEIAGHEWWGRDGKMIWYDLHIPMGVSSYIAGYDPDTRQRIWYHYERVEESIHFNVSPDGSLFCGDGSSGKESKWIYLFRPVRVTGKTLGTDLIQAGFLRSEKLCNMSRHNYRLEPNVSFTPDAKFVVFRSDMFGPTYAFAVEVAKAANP